MKNKNKHWKLTSAFILVAIACPTPKAKANTMHVIADFTVGNESLNTSFNYDNVSNIMSQQQLLNASGPLGAFSFSFFLPTTKGLPLLAWTNTNGDAFQINPGNTGVQAFLPGNYQGDMDLSCKSTACVELGGLSTYFTAFGSGASGSLMLSDVVVDNSNNNTPPISTPEENTSLLAAIVSFFLLKTRFCKTEKA